PFCTAGIHVTPEMVGRPTRCSACGQKLTFDRMPDEEPAAPEPEPEAADGLPWDPPPVRSAPPGTYEPAPHPAVPGGLVAGGAARRLAGGAGGLWAGAHHRHARPPVGGRPGRPGAGCRRHPPPRTDDQVPRPERGGVGRSSEGRPTLPFAPGARGRGLFVPP